MRRAFAFLTAFGGAAVPDARTLSWFPLAGALIGAALGAVWWGADRVWPPLVAAALVVAADVVLTGMLHVDGLVDTADGVLPHLPQERRLEVMAEPSVGAFGVTVAVTVLLLRLTSLAAIAPDAVLLASIWCASRTVMAVAARALPYARSTGLASALLGGAWRPVALYGTALAVGLGLAAEGAPGVAAVGAGVAAGAGVVVLARRRLGGFTGDVLGAAGIVGETAALLVAAARW
jgi:adenosylcobinamide-GDP ribazoletransferase